MGKTKVKKKFCADFLEPYKELETLSLRPIGSTNDKSRNVGKNDREWETNSSWRDVGGTQLCAV